MFLDTGIFKKLINQAFKGGGLTVGHDEEGIFLEGGRWAIWIRDGMMPNKEKANIIELTGEFPAQGEVFTAKHKYGNQYELDVKDIWKVNEAFKNAEREFTVTPVIITSKHTPIRILQEKATRNTVCIDNMLIAAINLDNLDLNIEDEPVGPVAAGLKSPIMYWSNGDCTYAACLRTTEDAQELNLLKLLTNMQFE